MHLKDCFGIGSKFILSPMQAFVEDERYAHVTKEMQAELITSVSEKITSQYDVLARDMVSVVGILGLDNTFDPWEHNCPDLADVSFNPNLVAFASSAG